ncbi:hypothetical protein D9M70_536830 [compost metagenome]
MQQVHQQQFLVLLLVGQAQLYPRRQLGIQWRLLQEPAHVFVDVRAIGPHPGQRRSRQQTALRPRLARAEGFVIGIEQVGEGGIERAVVRCVRGEQKGLEEPGGMGQVPFGRAGIGHRLDDHVLLAERRDQCRAMAADLQVTIEKRAVHRSVLSSPSGRAGRAAAPGVLGPD